MRSESGGPARASVRLGVGQRLRGRAVRAARWLRDRAYGDRGDVPGWVLVTVMTAGLVSALWIVADDLLAGIFRSAVDAVTGP